MHKSAFDGTNYLAVWSDSRHGSEIWGTRGPRRTEPSSTRAASASASGGGADVAFDGTNYLVVWGTAQGVSAVREHERRGVGHDSYPDRWDPADGDGSEGECRKRELARRLGDVQRVENTQHDPDGSCDP